MPAEHCQAAARAGAVKNGVKKTNTTGKVEYGTAETRPFVFFPRLVSEQSTGSSPGGIVKDQAES